MSYVEFWNKYLPQVIFKLFSSYFWALNLRKFIEVQLVSEN